MNIAITNLDEDVIRFHCWNFGLDYGGLARLVNLEDLHRGRERHIRGQKTRGIFWNQDGKVV